MDLTTTSAEAITAEMRMVLKLVAPRDKLVEWGLQVIPTPGPALAAGNNNGDGNEGKEGDIADKASGEFAIADER